MPRGLKTHLKVGKTKVEKGIPPMTAKGAPKSKAMPFEQKGISKMIPTIKKPPKSIKIKF